MPSAVKNSLVAAALAAVVVLAQPGGASATLWTGSVKTGETIYTDVKELDWDKSGASILDASDTTFTYTGTLVDYIGIRDVTVGQDTNLHININLTIDGEANDNFSIYYIDPSHLLAKGTLLENTYTPGAFTLKGMVTDIGADPNYSFSPPVSGSEFAFLKGSEFGFRGSFTTDLGDNLMMADAHSYFAPSAVPEPSTLLLTGCGLLATAILAKRRRYQKEHYYSGN